MPQTNQPVPHQTDHASPTAAPSGPPAPWTSWEQVKQMREALHQHRFLLSRRPEHLNTDQQAQVARLLDSAVLGCVSLAPSW